MKKDFKTDLLGKKFGKLTVISYEGVIKGNNNKYKSLWKCKCDCGNTTIRRRDNLSENKMCSCGCYLNGPRKDPKEMGITTVIANYKENAKAKGLDFCLTREVFSNLILSNCHYCNSEPKSISRHKGGHSRVVYNGIDRKDNSKGYIEENCVTCCRDCNYMKNSRNYEEFLDKVNKIYNNLLKD